MQQQQRRPQRLRELLIPLSAAEELTPREHFPQRLERRISVLGELLQLRRQWAMVVQSLVEM